MKRKLIVKRVIVLVFFLALFSKIYAQGQDNNHEWNGNRIEDVVNASDPNMKTVYLYNVGTHRFLNAGSYWATVTIGYTVGMGLHIQKSPTVAGWYKMTGETETTEGSTLAWGRKKDTPKPDNPINYNHVYVDRGKDGVVNGVIDWCFARVPGKSKTYTIHCTNDEYLPGPEGMGGDIYLQLEGSAADRLEMKYPHIVSSSDRNAQWKIVTLRDLKNAFKVKFASDEKPADATFLIHDQNFSRSHKDINKWVISGGLTSKPKTTNHSFYSDDGTYYVGIGSPSSDYYQAEYASRWVATVRNIGKNSNANGTVTQAVKILKKGWYILSCDGFYNATNGSSMKSFFFAKVEGYDRGSSNVSAELEKFRGDFKYTVEDLTKNYGDLDVGTESPYVQAGRALTIGSIRIHSLFMCLPMVLY